MLDNCAHEEARVVARVLGCGFGAGELARILLGDKLFLAREYGFYFRARGAFRSTWRPQAASLGKSANKLIGDLTALSYLLSR